MVVCRLLGSQVASDVHESIDFVVIAYEFGLNNVLLGVRRMLSLIWSKDNDVKSKVVDAYTRLYLNPQIPGQRFVLIIYPSVILVYSVFINFGLRRILLPGIRLNINAKYLSKRLHSYIGL